MERIKRVELVRRATLKRKKLKRQASSEETHGMAVVNGLFFCFLLENVEARKLHEKDHQLL